MDESCYLTEEYNFDNDSMLLLCPFEKLKLAKETLFCQATKDDQVRFLFAQKKVALANKNKNKIELSENNFHSFNHYIAEEDCVISKNFNLNVSMAHFASFLKLSEFSEQNFGMAMLLRTADEADVYFTVRTQDKGFHAILFTSKCKFDN